MSNFDYYFYKTFYSDLKDLNNVELKVHYIKHGKNEKRIKNMVEFTNFIQSQYFDPNFYENIHNLKLPINRYKNFDYSKQMLFTDCKVQLPNTFLEKVDKSTMANSIEVMIPFMDNNLSEYVMGLPSKYKVRAGNKKWILRQALKDELPGSILNGRKRGFNVPIDSWLKAPLSEYMCSVLLPKENTNGYLFNEKILQKKINNHLSGKENNGFILWKALNLAIWHNNL